MTTGQILRANSSNKTAWSTSTYPDTNAINTLLYASSANTMGSLATANSGVLTTSSTGVPSIDTTNFHVLSTGVQTKGNNTNTAPPAGFIGEQITANASAVSLVTATTKTITSINVTAGVWDISAFCHVTNTGSYTVVNAAISTTNNTMPAGNAGVTSANYTPPAAQALGGITLAPPMVRATLSGTTTYYIVANSTFTTGAGSANALITATRVG